MSAFVDPKRREEYILKEQRELPKEQQVVFNIRVLTAREWEERKDMVAGTETNGMMRMRLGTWVLYTLQKGLVNWSGPGAPKCDQNPQGGIADEALDRLHPDTRIELADAINDLTRLTLSDVKA